MGVRLHGIRSPYRNWRWADVVMITATPSNPPAFGRQQLWHCRESIAFIDVSQKGAVDYDAVWDGFAYGKIKYVASDVVPPSAFARTSGRILCTPHIGGSTRDCRAETELCVIREMRHRLETDLV